MLFILNSIIGCPGFERFENQLGQELVDGGLFQQRNSCRVEHALKDEQFSRFRICRSSPVTGNLCCSVPHNGHPNGIRRTGQVHPAF